MYQSSKRPNVRQGLPAITAAPNHTTRHPQYGLPATFVTQVMIERQRSAGQPQYFRPARNEAVEAYRRGGKVTVRHLPVGYGHAEVA